MKTKNYNEVLDFLERSIPRGPRIAHPGDVGIQRTLYFLKLLGNPQNNLKVIHIAGTSGKGSVATILAELLINRGFVTGMHISPYVLDIRERMQIGGKLISKKEFVVAFNHILPFYERVRKSQYGVPTYFELLTVMMFYVFFQKKVDYAVVETGMGGWYDATNVVMRKDKLCVLTRIGLDHTSVLGKTMSKIAMQKAMIMQKGNTAIGLWNTKRVIDVMKHVADQQGAFISFLKKGSTVRNINLREGKTVFDFSYQSFRWKKLELGLKGGYQSENAALALAAYLSLSDRDNFEINEDNVRKTLRTITYKGRFEIKDIRGRMVIFDGAHNPQKMGAFITNLRKIYPGQLFHFVIASKRGKDWTMFRYILPIASTIVTTSFLPERSHLPRLSENPEILAKHLKDSGFTKMKTISNPHTALNYVLAHTKGPIVITGSIYLIGTLYPSQGI